MKNSPITHPPFKFSEGQEVTCPDGAPGKVLKIADGKFHVVRAAVVVYEEKDLK